MTGRCRSLHEDPRNQVRTLGSHEPLARQTPQVSAQGLVKTTLRERGPYVQRDHAAAAPPPDIRTRAANDGETILCRPSKALKLLECEWHARVRRRSQHQKDLRGTGDHLGGTMAVRSPDESMHLVQHYQGPLHRQQTTQHLRLLHEIDRGDEYTRQSPGIHRRRQCSPDVPKVGGVHERRLKAEEPFQLAHPLLAQPRRHDDERPVFRSVVR
jgi:hypothetical protein